jgi:hypothetical protein
VTTILNTFFLNFYFDVCILTHRFSLFCNEYWLIISYFTTHLTLLSYFILNICTLRQFTVYFVFSPNMCFSFNPWVYEIILFTFTSIIHVYYFFHLIMFSVTSVSSSSSSSSSLSFSLLLPPPVTAPPPPPSSSQYIFQAGLKFPLSFRSILNSWPSYLSFPSAGITGMHLHTWLWFFSHLPVYVSFIFHLETWSMVLFFFYCISFSHFADKKQYLISLIISFNSLSWNFLKLLIWNCL